MTLKDIVVSVATATFIVLVVLVVKHPDAAVEFFVKFVSAVAGVSN